MTISALARSVEYAGDGSTTVFSVPFQFRNAADLRVTLIEADGDLVVKALTTHYTVSGGGSPPATGSVTMLAAPANGTSLLIEGARALAQQRSWATADRFPAAATEGAADDLTIMVQEAQKDLGALRARVPLVPYGETAPGLLGLDGEDGVLLWLKNGAITPLAKAQFAGKYFAGDGTGSPIPASGTGGGDAALREDLADADGVAMIGGLVAELDRRSITVVNIAALTALAKADLTNGQIVNVTGYSTPLDGGGGEFYWHSSAPTPEDGGLVFEADEGGAGRWLRIFQGSLNPLWYGAAGDRVADDTDAFAAMLSDTTNLSIEVPYSIYKVTHVDLDLIGRNYNGNGAVFEGHATTTTTSLVGLRGGRSQYFNLRLSCNFNLNYKCGLHWYTNRLDVGDRYYPGYVDTYGVQVEAAQIGLLIGAHPDQATIGTQEDIYDDDLAIDAPLSESVIVGFQATNCIVGAHMRQPNGKVCLVGARLASEMDDWDAYPNPERCTALVIANDGSELAMIGGELLHVQGGTNGTLAQITGGRLNAVGTVIESTVPIFIDGHSYVYLDHIQNFGMNFVHEPLIVLGPTADGAVAISKTTIIRPPLTASLYNGELIKSVSSYGGSFSPNFKIVPTFENSEFRDCPWRMGSTYQPLIRGVRARFKQCQLTTYDGSGTRTSFELIDDGPDLLRGVIDRTFKTIGTYAQTADGSAGGFTFDVDGAGSQWGIETTGLPVVADQPPYAWLRLTAGATGTCKAETDKFHCNPSKVHIVRGVIQTGATTATLKVIVKYFDHGGAATTVASFDLFNGQELQFGATAQPFMFKFTPHKEADQCSLYFEVQNGADCRVTLLEVN